MSEKQVTKKQRIIYYSILATLIILIGVVTVIALTNKPVSDTELNKPTQSGDTGSGDNGDSGQKPVNPDDGNKPNDDRTDNSDDKPDDKPVAEVISFITPVQGGTVLKEYTDNSVVYSSTLGVYTGHMGVDFKGAENAKVVAAYKGTVKEITTAYLTGTTVKIDHGNGLYSVYNSVEPVETLKVGDKVEQGDTLGTVSTNNKQEYKDGAHLHFEVIENNVKISPLKYLTTEEK